MANEPKPVPIPSPPSTTSAQVSGERLTLIAQGPISLEVEYAVRPAPCGSRIHASISVLGQGLIGRLLARATETLLAAGALQGSVNRLANQPQPAIAI